MIGVKHELIGTSRQDGISLKRIEKELTASMLATETYVKEAEDALKRTPPNHLVASHFMQQAETFRTIRGTKEETANAKARAELKKFTTVLQYQEESRNELIASYHKVDISEMVEQARTHVRGKNFQDALFKLALLGAPTNVPPATTGRSKLGVWII